MIYFDTSYIARLYVTDSGYDAVRSLAAGDQLVCCIHGRAETLATFHRKFREEALMETEFRLLIEQFEADCAAGAFRWLPLSQAVMERVRRTYAGLPKTIHVRAADSIHLACAAENKFKAIYSNDERLLAAAVHFGIKGINILF